jgi:hypothetical protein
MAQRRPQSKPVGKSSGQSSRKSTSGNGGEAVGSAHAEQHHVKADEAKNIDALEAAVNTVEGAHFEQVKPWKHVTIWLIGVVIASLAPLLWAYVSPKSAPPSIYQVLGKGDLFLISVVLLIAGITEIILLTKRISQDFTVALLIIGGFLIAIFDAAKYAGASAASAGPAAPPNSVTYWAIAAFVVSTIHSSVCVWLAAGVR